MIENYQYHIGRYDGYAAVTSIEKTATRSAAEIMRIDPKTVLPPTGQPTDYCLGFNAGVRERLAELAQEIAVYQTLSER